MSDSRAARIVAAILGYGMAAVFVLFGVVFVALSPAVGALLLVAGGLWGGLVWFLLGRDSGASSSRAKP